MLVHSYPAKLAPGCICPVHRLVCRFPLPKA